jgi:vacuolar-type H+-ATPase subunit C/Vma6
MEIERLNDLHLATILQSGRYKVTSDCLTKRLRVVENIVLKRKRFIVGVFNNRVRKLLKKLLNDFDLSNIE